MEQLLEAGPELDELVAEKVMGQGPCDGWRPFMHDSHMKYCDHMSDVCYPRGACAHYSRNIEAAWAVVERMADLGFWFDLHDDFAGTRVFAFMPKQDNETHMAGRIVGHASGTSVPLIICRAALLALGVVDVPR